MRDQVIRCERPMNAVDKLKRAHMIRYDTLLEQGAMKPPVTLSEGVYVLLIEHYPDRKSRISAFHVSSSKWVSSIVEVTRVDLRVDFG